MWCGVALGWRMLLFWSSGDVGPGGSCCCRRVWLVPTRAGENPGPWFQIRGPEPNWNPTHPPPCCLVMPQKLLSPGPSTGCSGRPTQRHSRPRLLCWQHTGQARPAQQQCCACMALQRQAVCYCEYECPPSTRVQLEGSSMKPCSVAAGWGLWTLEGGTRLCDVGSQLRPHMHSCASSERCESNHGFMSAPGHPPPPRPCLRLSPPSCSQKEFRAR